MFFFAREGDEDECRPRQVFAAVAFLARETRRNNVMYGRLFDQAAGGRTGAPGGGGGAVARKGPPMEVELC